MARDGRQNGARELTIPRAVGQSRLLFAVTAVVVGLLAMLFGLTRQPLYVASASIVIRPQAADATSNPQTQVPIDAKRYVADQASVLKLVVTADAAARIVNAKLSGDPSAASPTTTAATSTSSVPSSTPPSSTTQPATSSSTSTSTVALNRSDIAPNSRVTSKDIQDHLSLRTNPDGSLIELHYSDADPTLASIVVNSVVEAYQEVKRSQAQSSSSSAVQQLQGSITSVDAELTDIDTKLNALINRSPVSQELERRYAQVLQAAAGDSAESLTAATALQARIQVLQAAQQAEQQAPAYVALTSQRTQATARRAALQSQLDAVRLQAENVASDVALFSPAEVPDSPQGFKPIELGIIGLLFGTIPAAVLCYVVALQRPKLTTARDAEAVLGAPLLAEVPDFKHEGAPLLPVRWAPMTLAAESFQFLAASLLPLRVKHPSWVLGVVSALPGDGKSVTTANLSMAMGSGTDVLAIDADIDGRGLSSLFGADPEHPGVLDVLDDDIPLDEALMYIQAGANVEVRVLPLQPSRGRVRDRESLSSADMGRLLDEARGLADVVLVDLPPILSTAYASSILHFVDGILVVLPLGTRLRDLEQLRERLDLLGAPVVGYVVNRTAVRPYRGSSAARPLATTKAKALDLNGTAAPQPARR